MACNSILTIFVYTSISVIFYLTSALVSLKDIYDVSEESLKNEVEWRAEYRFSPLFQLLKSKKLKCISDFEFYSLSTCGA